MRCPYCHRPLRGLGARCRACRRYVLNWMHYTAFGVLALLLAFLVLDLFMRL